MQSNSFRNADSSTTGMDGANPRHLNDDVLQSAGDAWVGESTSQGRDSYSSDAASEASSSSSGRSLVHAPDFYPERSSATSPPTSSYRDSLGQYVATKPFQSALMAVAAGALAALMLQLKVRKWTGSRGWKRGR
jgi:hypothetical protein